MVRNLSGGREMLGTTYVAWAFAFALAVWLTGLFLTVLYCIVGGRISLQGLLTESLTGNTALVSRPQMLFVSLAASATFVGAAIAAVGTTNQFPEVPQALLLTVGGSQALYLGGRGIAGLLSKTLSRGGGQ